MTLETLKSKFVRLHKSFTNWFNGTIVSLGPLLIDAKDQLPLLKSYVAADLYKYLFIATVVGNVLIRVFKTNKPLEDK